MTEYKLNKKVVDCLTEYGIDIIIDNLIIGSIESISENRLDIVALVEMCNELKIEPCQIDYVIEDYLTDFCLG